ncbi:15-hydroxyprostaglandin dehydrogenase [NAD(+)] [Holothuria leucospilota]|uniref:15-hydroxyprostaglandin dehydrogenase [NAD(+)] n=1 Tax=Holothuria leucospilota TaxID=206669 RepID=A0A9Q1CE60_HOLLE|nr:15-hydroxyprostaglandin dehydrogenase [NAD(+)] [Holothuria leucospilota]
MKINGICAIVTGGVSGIGKALVERLLSKGAKFVALIDINKHLGEETVKDFKEKFGSEKVRFIHCDVTSESQLEKAFEESFSVNSRLDVVVNSAGLLKGPKVIQVNLEALIRSSYLAKKYMSKQNGGSGGLLINVSSIAGFIASFDPIYAASKHGVKGFSLALTVFCQECDPAFTQDDIRVGVICPTALDTPLYDIDPSWKAKLSTLNLVPMSLVVDAFVLVIEDDSKHGCCVRITEAYGVDLLPMKTANEWITELKIFKS